MATIPFLSFSDVTNHGFLATIGEAAAGAGVIPGTWAEPPVNVDFCFTLDCGWLPVVCCLSFL